MAQLQGGKGSGTQSLSPLPPNCFADPQEIFCEKWSFEATEIFLQHNLAYPDLKLSFPVSELQIKKNFLIYF